MYPAAAHEMLQVSCDVDAHPSAVDFHWSFNGSLRNHEVQTFVSEGTRSIASYVPREKADYGSLLCWAANKIGRQKTPCEFKVLPVGTCIGILQLSRAGKKKYYHNISQSKGRLPSSARKIDANVDFTVDAK